MTKSNRIRWLAKKLSVPCWIHSENIDMGVVSRTCGSLGRAFACVLVFIIANLLCCSAASSYNIGLNAGCVKIVLVPLKTERIVIKKYENRRLYDSSSSRYVNLDDVAALIRKGADVQIVDAKTGEDLTRATLTQIILEESKEQPSGL